MVDHRKPILMAVIGAAHGIRGEVRVKTFTSDPLALGNYGPLYAKDGRAFEILDIRPAGTVVVVRLKGVNDRGAAEALNGTELFVDRSLLPDDTEGDEFYHADLVGLAVRDENDETVGKVTAVQNYGGGDILEITHGGTKGVLVPFTQAAVPLVDVAAGFVRIDTVAAGLSEEDGDARPPADDAPGETRRGFDRRPRGPKGAGGNR
jgi:16S rRNA processing protein RimM